MTLQEVDASWLAIRAVGLLSMLVLLASAVLPSMRAHRRLLLGGALGVYVTGGIMLIAWHYLVR